MHTLNSITCFEVRILTDSLLYVHLDLAGDLAAWQGAQDDYE